MKPAISATPCCALRNGRYGKRDGDEDHFSEGQVAHEAEERDRDQDAERDEDQEARDALDVLHERGFRYTLLYEFCGDVTELRLSSDSNDDALSCARDDQRA